MTDQTTNWPDHLTGDAQPLEVGILLYEGHTALDLVGPYTTFALAGMKVHLVAETLDPVVSDDGGMTIAPTTTFDDCPERLDILFVPGGGMVYKPMLDPATIAWLADRGATASYITAVCNGPLVLAAAGLLDGYRVATHWASRDQLARLGVEVSTERVCIDRNRFSGGGVTAGIDFGLTVVAHTLGDGQGVLGIRFGLAAAGAGHAVDRATGHVDRVLTVRDEQGQQQGRGTAGDVHRPPHLVGARPSSLDQRQHLRLVVDHLRREPRLA